MERRRLLLLDTYVSPSARKAVNVFLPWSRSYTDAVHVLFRVAPFCGCLFGGILYDIFIYTGPSPINTPYMGLAKLFGPKKAIKERVDEQKTGGLV